MVQKDIPLRSIHVEGVIDMPRLPDGITTASLVSSAWAVVLSHISGNNDVVYGHIVAGRNSDISGITEIVGPCFNVVPVRVPVYPTATSICLLRSVQEQYVSLGDSDSMGFDEIVRNCTDWPATSEFDSVVKHQNVDEHPGFHVGGRTTKLEWFKNPFWIPSRLDIVSYPLDGKLRLTIESNTHILTVGDAHLLLSMLSETVTKLSSELQTSLAACKSFLPVCPSKAV
jgi:non-ribosomal peptide synthetase component F